MEVDTELTSDGHFWCQLRLPSSEGEGDRPLDELRVATAREEGEPFTPVFYNEGDLCAAQFSEDGRWYRARIERVIPGVVRIFYGMTTNAHTLTLSHSHGPHTLTHS